MKLILTCLAIFFFFFFLLIFSISTCARIRGSYRVLEIKQPLSHTHLNRGAGANNLFSLLFFFLLTVNLVGVIDRPKKGAWLSQSWVTPYIRHNLRPKLKGKKVPNHLFLPMLVIYPFFIFFFSLFFLMRHEKSPF